MKLFRAMLWFVFGTFLGGCTGPHALAVRCDSHLVAINPGQRMLTTPARHTPAADSHGQTP